MSFAATVLKEALPRTKEYILYNVGDDEIHFRFWGVPYTIPPRTVAVSQKDHPEQFSAFDADGELICGTLIIRDIVRRSSIGSETIWSADACVQHLFHVNSVTGAASGPNWERGMTVLPPAPTKAQIREAFVEGRKRYEDWKLAQAREVVASFDAANDKRQKLGMPTVPGGDDYVNAVMLIRAVMEAREQALKVKLELLPERPSSALTAAEEAELREAAKETAETMGADPETIYKKLSQDPNTISALKRKRKEG